MPVDEKPAPPAYPVTLDATLDQPSRGLWLVKWFLLIPHYIVLAFLMVGMVVVWFAALVAIVVTGRYPRPLFDYTLGVLRWLWRVGAYGYGVAGTDRYPPFTLNDVPDYPARLDVTYPEHLSRGRALVKWWLLAIPHYIITSLLYSGLVTYRFAENGDRTRVDGTGIITLLVLVAVIVLLFRGSYPQSLFDIVVGLQRWGYRVAGYALLLTDVYPPFRLDLGGTDPAHRPPAASTLLGEPPLPVAPTPTAGPGLAGPGLAGPGLAGPGLAGPGTRAMTWTAGRIAALVAGALLVLTSGGILLGAAGTAFADRTARDADGYLSTGRTAVSTAGYAVTTETFSTPDGGPGWAQPSWSLGTLRARVTGDDAGRPVFLGVAHRADVDAYLTGVEHSVLTGFDDRTATYNAVTGTSVPAAPGQQSFWISRAEGTGTQQVTWSADEPSWVLVLMNSDPAAGVRATADLGGTLPILGRITAGLVVGGVIVLVAGTLLMVVAFRPTTTGRTPTPTPAVTA
jgi:hypothetical protein